MEEETMGNEIEEGLEDEMEDIEVETIETFLTAGEIDELMAKLEDLKQTKIPITCELADDLELTINHEEDEEE
ncbi:MAG: hypothetical protein ABH864_03420 [archaeon]